MWRCVITRLISSLSVVACVLTGCAGTGLENRLIGDWVMDGPITPHAYGNIVEFRAGCLIVSGNAIDVRTAQPIHFYDEGLQTFVWYGPSAMEESLRPARAARVTFLAPDRILIRWPEGFDARYMRGVGTSESNQRCG